MPQLNSSKENEFDPSGSIFLPKTEYPERELESWRVGELESWRLQLLLGCGVAEGMEYEQFQDLSDELQAVRARCVGMNTLGAL